MTIVNDDVHNISPIARGELCNAVDLTTLYWKHVSLEDADRLFDIRAHAW